MIERKSIKVTRTPVKLPQNIKMQLKIEEMENLTREDDIIAIAEHYSMLARKVLNVPRYNALSLKNVQKHKNWIHFERVYEVCRMKKWDSKLYIEAQFLRAKDWKTRYPFVNTLYSVSALRFFTNHCSTIEQTYKGGTDVEKRKRGKETQTLRTEVVEQITKSVENLSFYIEISNFEDKEQYKVTRIFQYWQEISPYYLWSIPWFHRALTEFPDKEVQPLLETFTLISKSTSLQKIITEVVSQVEKYYNIPSNLTL